MVEWIRNLANEPEVNQSLTYTLAESCSVPFSCVFDHSAKKPAWYKGSKISVASTGIFKLAKQISLQNYFIVSQIIRHIPDNTRSITGLLGKEHHHVDFSQLQFSVAQTAPLGWSSNPQIVGYIIMGLSLGNLNHFSFFPWGSSLDSMYQWQNKGEWLLMKYGRFR